MPPTTPAITEHHGAGRRPLGLAVAVGPLLVALCVAGLLAVSTLVGRFEVPSGGALPPAPPTPLQVADPVRAAELRASGITVDGGWEPMVVFGDVDPWSLVDPELGVAGWVESLPQLRFGEDEATNTWFVEDAVVLREPANCYHVARVVRSVGVALPSPAGVAIADVLTSWLEPRYFTPVLTPVGPGPCSTTDRSQWGFAIAQAQPRPCASPAREIVCFTVAKWRSDAGARDTWTSAHLAFDATSGVPLQDTDLHPQLDVAALRTLVADALCTHGATCTDVRWRNGQIVPYLDRLVIELSPGEGADPVHGSLRVDVPRTLLPLSG